MTNSKIDIAAMIAEIEPDLQRQLVILRRMIQAAARECFPPPPSTDAPRFAGGLPPDHAKGFGLPQSVLDDMKAVPDTLMNDIVKDQRQGVAQPSGVVEPRNITATRGEVMHGFREAKRP